MAKPFGPKFDRSLVKRPPPDARDDAADESFANFPHPTPEDGPSNGHLPEPWLAAEEPLAQTSGAGPAVESSPDAWEGPAFAPEPPPGGFPGAERLPAPEAAAKPPAQTVGVDLSAFHPAGYFVDGTDGAQDLDPEMDPAESSPLFLGRRPLYKRSEPAPSAEEQLANVIDFLQKLQTNIRNTTPAAEAPSAAALGLSLLQLRRLSRTGVVPDHFEIGVLPKPPRVEPPPPADPDPAPAAQEVAKSPEILPSSAPVRLKRSHAVSLVLIGMLCCVTLCLVAYLWTRLGPLPRASVGARTPVGHGTPGPTPEPEVSEEALNLASLALEAIQQNDLKRASDILTKAQKQGVALPGLNYQAALLAFNQGQREEAENAIERSIAANEAVADCWYLRANSTFFTEGPAKAAEDFEQSVQAAPFSPRFYFFRAECLRRNGNATAAVAQFQQALRCRPSSTDTELILFKIGLTKIETNTDLIFKTELRDRLAQEPVSGDTLLLAAADAISRNEFAEAAEFLKRAALDLPPRIFQSRIRDYVFQTQIKQPDIAAVVKLTLSVGVPGQTTPRSGRVLIDPATRSLAEADPAGW